MSKPMDRDDYELVGPDDLDNEFRVWSETTKRGYYGSTLTIARHNRSEAEQVYREHHAKNKDN